MTPAQRACLDAMEIDVWVRRGESVEAESDVALRAEEGLPDHIATAEVDHIASPLRPETGDNSPIAAALKSLHSPVVSELPHENQPNLALDARREHIESDDWTMLQQRVSACTQCDLSASRTQTVFGIGDQQADWMIIGEAPGAEEDRKGEPFVGRAGQLLTSMLRALGLRRDQVYIANILKCRPPNNRDPQAHEVEQCEAYLARQIALIQPRLILCVGRIAAQNLLKTTTPLSRLRGRPHVYGERSTPVVVTYHPAYLLRTPIDKRKAWDDLQLAQSLIREPTS